MNNYRNNREKLYRKIPDNSLLVLYSGALKQCSADESYPFRVNTNFYYMTGINQDNVYLLVTKVRGEIEEHLFVYENDPIKVKWIGAYLYPEEAKEISGVDNIHFVKEFDAYLLKQAKRKGIKNICLDLEKSYFDGQVDFGKILKDKVNAYCYDKKIIDVYSTITLIRGVKEPWEVEIYQKAVDTTKLALEEVMKELPNIEYEYQAQALFEYQIKKISNARISFETTAASGKNAAILHYHANNEKLEGKNMILLDLGAEFGKYHADITRTYPIKGKYGELERKIYQSVLDCNKHIISIIKPGLTIMDLQKETISFLTDECLKHGLIKEKEEIRNHYFHGISHHIGLDTHDPHPRYAGTLVPGMIISVEPGLYFEDLGIGVRIEDDILVTENGCDNLSKDIIKEVDDIEAFMAKYN